ncbi:MAG: hypothetical protein JXB10_00330 [Pirellulales bacterium]|nr:hypothetical protein [Pirellulales bacterium]
MDFIPELTYKPNARVVFERLIRFYDRSSNDRILAVMLVPSPALRDFQAAYPHPECGYPDPAERADFWDRYLQERAVLEDDSLPLAYLSEFDQGLYGGLFGGEVRFLAHPDVGWISSMVPPLLTDWNGLEQLHIDSDHPWWQRYLRQMRIFVERSRAQTVEAASRRFSNESAEDTCHTEAAGCRFYKWGISHFILIDGLNFVFELVGATNAYLSVEERPETVRRAIDLGYELNVRVQQTFFETVGLFAGGTFSNFAQWMPGRIVSESLDPFHMTSVAYFEKWGREPAERIMNAFDGGVIHIHANGRHLLPAAATLRGLKAILLLDDLGYPPAFDVLADLKAKTGEIPLAVFAEYEKFVQRLSRRELPGGVLYQVKNVPDVATANRLMKQVRDYRV